MAQFQSHFPVLSIYSIRTSLAIQWVRFSVSSARGMSLISGWGTKIPHATWSSQEMGGKVYILSICFPGTKNLCYFLVSVLQAITSLVVSDNLLSCCKIILNASSYFSEKQKPNLVNMGLKSRLSQSYIPFEGSRRESIFFLLQFLEPFLILWVIVLALWP